MNIPPDLKLEFDSRTARQPGDFIDGTVVVEAVKDVKATVAVWLEFRLHGRGNSHSEEATRRQIVFDGELSEGVHSYPFSIEIPNGPFTYTGHYLNLTWFVRATADVPWAIDPNSERDFVLDYEPTGLPLAHVPHQFNMITTDDGVVVKSSGTSLATSGAMVSAGVAFGLCMIGALVGASSGAEVLFPVAIFVGISLMIAAFTLRNAASRKIAESKLGPVQFAVTPNQPSPGDEIRVALSFTPQKPIPLNRATCRLQATERVVRGSGTNRTTYTHELFDQHFALQDSPIELQPGEEQDFACVMSLPEDAPFSVDFPDNELEWSMEVRLDIEGWPDWVKKQPFNVLPSARMLPSETSNPVAVVASDVPDEGVW